MLSAKFGLLHPDEIVAAHDIYLPKQSQRYRSAWARWVVAQLGERHSLHDAVIEAHAGSAYCDPLSGPLAEAGATLTQPVAGLGLGRRLAWYGGAAETPEQPIATTTPTPEVAWLLDERNAVSPADFLAAGRVSSDQPGLYTWWTDAEGAHALMAGLGHALHRGSSMPAARAECDRMVPAPRTRSGDGWRRCTSAAIESSRPFD